MCTLSVSTCPLLWQLSMPYMVAGLQVFLPLDLFYHTSPPWNWTMRANPCFSRQGDYSSLRACGQLSQPVPRCAAFSRKKTILNVETWLAGKQNLTIFLADSANPSARVHLRRWTFSPYLWNELMWMNLSQEYFLPTLTWTCFCLNWWSLEEIWIVVC